MSKASTELGVSPGILADAHMVRTKMRRGYCSWNKDAARKRAVNGVVAAGASNVLTLWGGGRDSDLLGDAGVGVIAVDDGRDPRIGQLGISVERYRRSMELCSAERGALAHWGPAKDYLTQADAAILDFMAHWSAEIRETLSGCRHMKAVAVTLMIGRLSLGEQLTDQEWAEALGALAESATFMRVRWYHIYRRNEREQRAIVLFLRPGTRSGLVGRCACGDFVPPGHLKCAACLARRYHQRPDLPKQRVDPFYSEDAKARRRAHARKDYELHRDNYLRLSREAYERKSGKSREEIVAAQLERDMRVSHIQLLIGNGLRTGDIARSLGVSTALVSYHRKRLAAVSGTAAEAVSSD